MSAISQNNIILPIRKDNAHKGDHGSVAIIGGASGMVGAAVLASRAALLSGAGRVYASFLADAIDVDLNYPEIMVRQPEALCSLTPLDCVVIGPGLGTSAQATALLSLWLTQKITLVIDADALNLIASDHTLSHSLAQRDAATIITPHPGEAAKLLQTTSNEVQENRIESALKLARLFQAICVLKGSHTLVAYEDQYFSNITGNAGLASGGSGDVLSGIIGSLVAQGLDTIEAVKTAVYIHGAAADSLVAKKIGPIGLTASEVSIEVRYLLNTLK